jgi:hypothetical protein
MASGVFIVRFFVPTSSEIVDQRLDAIDFTDCIGFFVDVLQFFLKKADHIKASEINSY